jgi:NADP-dependent 3-hydroxy acid dehydrogenase YdfG
LVNNAAIMLLSRCTNSKIDEWNRMIDVNIRGVLHGIAAVLPLMRERKSGHIINVSSIGGTACGRSAPFTARLKFAVNAISEGLRQENTDVRVTIISPGVVESNWAVASATPAAREMMQEFRATALSPDAIARAIAYAIEQPADVNTSEMIVRPHGERQLNNRCQLSIKC